MRTTRQMKRRLISLYTGVGGLDLGFEAAGFEVAVAVEMDADAVQALQKNREWRVVAAGSTPKPIEAISSAELLRTGHLGVGEASVLIGGPPCQPFSKAGYWASGDSKRLKDPRAKTIEHFLRVLQDAQPEAYLLENVPGLNFDAKNEGLRYIERRIDQINRKTHANYTIAVKQLNAADYGVPQFRHRVFVIGHRDGKQFHFPAEPLFSIAAADPRRRYSTAWDAIGEFADDDDPTLKVTGRWAALLPSIPEGKNYLWHTARGGGKPLFGWRTRYWTFLLKLSKRRPAWTLQAQPGPAIGPFHWKNRRLSARELCRLQTIPDDYQVPGSIRVVQRLLGNAVPSALAEYLARQIRHQFFAEEIGTAPRLLPKREGGSPPAEESPRRVHRQYLSLVGNHAEHPGTGLGPAARRRR